MSIDEKKKKKKSIKILDRRIGRPIMSEILLSCLFNYSYKIIYLDLYIYFGNKCWYIC